MAPQVSVIVPVYNSVDYVRGAVQSVLDQTIDPGAVEIIAVDDGSTDGSAAVLAELAATHSRLTVITQENSGTPGGGRNPAISRATGEFIFFLDSDDRLTPDALRRMVDVAQAEGSDVVLGKMTSTDKRKAPSTMFKESVLDADLLRDKVFNTLGPTKLIRRELIDRLHLRFPEDQKVGEDQPFMAAAYLNSRKISVLSDMDYYVIQHRTDGSNLTLLKEDSAAHLQVAVRLAQVIEQYTEPGEFRDGLLKRPFGWSMKRALDARWQDLSGEEQHRLAELFRSEIGHLYTEGLRRMIEVDIRSILDLLVAGDLDPMNDYIAYLATGAARRIEWSDGAFRRHLPADIAHLVPQDQRVVTAPKMTCRLEDVRVDGSLVTVAASVTIAGLHGAPDGLGIRARQRNAGAVEDFRITSADLTAGARSFAVAGEHDNLRRGVWDLFVLVRFGDFAKELRLGADRARAVEPEGASNLGDDPVPQDRVIAYFTQGPGNLSIDRGAVLHRSLGRARAVGLTLDENERPVMLVETTSEPVPADEFFGYLEGVEQHTGRHLLPSVRLGDRLIGLRLPITEEMIGVRLTVTSVLGGARSPLRAVGTEFWPARAAGFGLALDEDGALHVTAPGQSGRNRYPLPQFGAETLRGPLSGARQRAAAAVRTAPVIGPTLTRVVRSIRRRRS